MKKLLFWSIMVVSLAACSGNKKNITYTTTNGEIIEVKQIAFDAEIVSNTYKNGEGKIVFDKPLTSIANAAFYDCSSLTSITIPDSVTSIGWYAFYGCSSLTSITIPDSVASIGWYAFYGCSSLTSVTIPNSVTSIGGCAFDGCSSLTSITIPNSVTSIGDCAFYGCTSLTSITIPNSVTSIGGGVFHGSGIINDNANWEKGVLYMNDCLIKAKESVSGAYIIKKGTRLIGGNAFDGCSSLTSVTVPNSVTSIGDCAFWDCYSLTSITIPKSVTSIGKYAFENCYSLTSITIPNSVTSIGKYAFENCSSLTSVEYNGTKEQWYEIEMSGWAFDSYIQALHCTDGEIRL